MDTFSSNLDGNWYIWTVFEIALTDEDYFKDKSRFNKAKDERDPLYYGMKDKGAEYWGSYFREGFESSREQFSKMKESEPLTFRQYDGIASKDPILIFSTHHMNVFVLLCFQPLGCHGH